MDTADLKRTALLRAASVYSQQGEGEERDEVPELLGAETHTHPRKSKKTSLQEYAPQKSDDCFATALEVDVWIQDGCASGTIRTYYTPPKSDVCKGCTVIVCHHGAGAGALSFALLARDITAMTDGEVGVLAYDCRGHGKTRFSEERRTDMSLEALRGDLEQLLMTMFPDDETRPNFILVGHSMGGAVVVAAAHSLQHMDKACISGVAMIDIVEGTSLQVLPEMSKVVCRRPAGFSSLEDAIRWHVQSHSIRNLESARRSVPSLLYLADETSKLPWRWRTDLMATEPFWQGWFKGLSSSFLSLRAARMLILAQSDNLDRELMIGSMQGKFQLVVSPHAGHYVQEVRILSATDAGYATRYGRKHRPFLAAQRKAAASDPRAEASGATIAT